MAKSEGAVKRIYVFDIWALFLDAKKRYEASLIKRKMYEVIPDAQAEQDDFIRIVDESGEDYLYHKSHFVSLELPAEVERALVAA